MFSAFKRQYKKGKIKIESIIRLDKKILDIKHKKLGIEENIKLIRGPYDGIKFIYSE